MKSKYTPKSVKPIISGLERTEENFINWNFQILENKEFLGRFRALYHFTTKSLKKREGI